MSKDPKNMSLLDFEDCIDRFGPDLSTWPGDRACLAKVLIEKNDQARQIHEEAEQLRKLFKQSASVKAPAGLADRIFSQISNSK